MDWFLYDIGLRDERIKSIIVFQLTSRLRKSGMSYCVKIIHNNDILSGSILSLFGR